MFNICKLLSFFIFFQFSYLAEATTAPQATTCITGTFVSSGDQYWREIRLTLTNNCAGAVNLQNATVTFENESALNTQFWGQFGSLSYPNGTMNITSQPKDSRYLATLNLQFPTYVGSNSTLSKGGAITLIYGNSKADFINGSVLVYTNLVVSPGTIELSNKTAKPSNVTQTYAVVKINANNVTISQVNLPWSSTKLITGLAPQTYSIVTEAVTASNGAKYIGTATPSSLTVLSNQTVKSSITYQQQVTQTGKLAIQLQSLPTALSGYTGKPTVAIIQQGSSTSISQLLSWGQTTTIGQLKQGAIYTFSTPEISYNGYQCKPTFTPTSLTASSTTTPVTKLTYTCGQQALSRVNLKVIGGQSSLTQVKVILTPNNNTQAVTSIITLTNGTGTGTLNLATGTIYTLSIEPISGYSASFSPQPLTVSNDVLETITLTPQTAGTPVANNGQLTVCGTQLCNEKGVPIQLKGMSSHGLQWFGWGKCLTPASLDALAKEFNANVVRISLYVQEGGYETNPTLFTNQVDTLINEATNRGLYVIVDWHMLSPGDPNYNLTLAKKFFTDIVTLHKNNNNILYEIANEPNGVSWQAIKNYANEIIPVIRNIDPKAPILVGTRGWSSLGVSDGSSSQEIVNSPVNFPNIMYTFHFYAASHRDNYLNELDQASKVLPIFVTEFGTQTYSGDGGNDFAMATRYMDLMAQRKIGWTNWNYSDDFRSGAIWNVGTCSNGPWSDSNLKPAGVYIKDKIKN